jgi:RNA polymerase sigma factor (sigma-70 family)
MHPGEDPCETSLHVRKAVSGDRESLEWLVVRLSPLLFLEARERLGPHLGKLYDPDDLVQDAWLVTLPRLAELPARNGRYTPVVLRFLSTCILNRVNTLLQKHLGQVDATRARLAMTSVEEHSLPAETTDVVSRVTRSDTYQRILQALERLPELERKIILLRGVEQASPAEVGVILGLKPNTVVVKYRRALEKLRQRVPQSVLDELDEPGDEEPPASE